ncbi:ATP-binding cassette domain-containing protein [Streptomyces sp. NPDC056149]|uniref:ABC transporter ATP-binding protein n=1 Tax=unclassified Streptomyces TaxID=2593676 RepID=UPI0023818E77|nr:ATP-binding cassette domain-containing protein [Streptomyces sp. WZ-12]
MTDPIEMRSVTRTFTVRTKTGRFRSTRREVAAVDDLSFSVAAGEFVGYLGANGAGKSTSIKLLTGVLAPTTGQVRVLGHDPFDERAKTAHRLGTMSAQRIQLWWDLPLRDSFEQLRYIYRVDAARYRARLDELVDVLGLADLLPVPVRQLSLGQRIRGELAASVLHSPDVLFLDEPTIGLDVIAKQRIRAFLTTLNREQGVTILLTTHDMADLERMCSRLLVLSKGKLICDDSISRLMVAHGLERTLVVDLTDPHPPLRIPGARVSRVEGPRQWLSFSTRSLPPDRLIAEITKQARIVDLTINEPDVEDLVRALHETERR